MNISAKQYNLDIENSIVGTLLSNNNFVFVSDAVAKLRAEFFVDVKNKNIIQVIEKLVLSGINVDLLSVKQKATELGFNEASIGSAQELIAKCNLQVVEDIFFDRVELLINTFLGRKIYQLIETKKSLLIEGLDSRLIGNSIVENIQKLLSSFNTEKQLLSLDESLQEVSKTIDENRTFVKEFQGIPTGFQKFDWKAGGLHKGDLNIIAARSGQGKTSFALTIANNIAMSGGNVVYYSLEMPHNQLSSRILAMNSDIDISSTKILFGRLNDDEYNSTKQTISKIYSNTIFYDDENKSTLDGIIASVRKNYSRVKVDVIVVDYIQILSRNGNRGMNEEQVLAECARKLKNLAMDLNICVLALSQLRRYEKGDPEPNVSDLRGSGQIEEAADNVLTIYRPEEFGITQWQNGQFKGQSTENMARISIAKGRNIGTFSFYCGFEKSKTKFYKIDYDSHE